MDAFEQLNEDLRTGQIDTETYVLFLQRQILAALQKLQELQGLQQELQRVRQELEAAQQRIAELERQTHQKPTSSPTAKVEQAYSMREEEKRQQKKQGKKKKHKLSKKGRRGRLTTADKIAVAARTEDCYPVGVPPQDCKLSHTRVVWQLEKGQAVLVAYQVYRGPNDQYGKPANVLGRSEFSLEIVVEVATLVYVMGLSFEKVCATLGFLQNLKLGKTQVDRMLHQLARHWHKEFDILCTLLANSLVAHADETSWSINSVWVFLSEKARVLLYGVNKTTATLLALLDPKVFAGILISDDYAVYANFSKAQKCWAHLLRKAIKLTLEDPANEAYRGLTDELLDIYRQACRAKSDGRLGEAGRAGKVAALTERLEELCGDGENALTFSSGAY